MNSYLVLVPLLSAFVGWATNVAAVRLLFWPVRPVRIPGLPWVLQGVIPRRQQAIARSVADMVEKVLVRPEELLQALQDHRYEREVVQILVGYVDHRLQQSVARYLPSRVRDTVVGYVRTTLEREAPAAARALMDRWRARLGENWQVAPAVARRVAQMDPGEFEAILLRVIGRELRWLEALGAVLGFLVGLVQLALLGPVARPA